MHAEWWRVLPALLVVITAARLTGFLVQRIRQPAVIGEMIAGILLGPSLLGWVAPELSQIVFPKPVVAQLGLIANVGVVLFMFLVGVELDARHFLSRLKATLSISVTSIAVPFAIGALLSLWLYEHFALPGSSRLVFFLFIGVSMSVTAFPVLARILEERKLTSTPLGVMALSCAAVDDVAAWCLLALVAGLANQDASKGLTTLLISVGYVIAMLALVRPIVVKIVRRIDGQGLTRPVLGVACMGLLASALAAELAGIHAIFGAFLLGAVVPADSRIARELRERIEDLVVVLMLPAFFAITGLRTQLSLLAGADAVGAGLLILGCAVLGKLGGGFAAAKLNKLPTREALSLGVLMNTRGLVELVVLNLGLEMGILNPTLFALLVAMALITTFMTSPALSLIESSQANGKPASIAP